MTEGMERERKGPGEKGNGIYLGSVLRNMEKARKKNKSV